MSQSLYSVLKPLVFQGESGVLRVKHRYGDVGTIELREGLISRVETGGREGREAVLLLNCWISLNCEFAAGDVSSDVATSGVDTSEVLKFLEKVEKISEKMKKLLPDHGMIIKLSREKLRNNSKLNEKDVALIKRIGGQSSVETLIRDSDDREIDVLAGVCRLLSLGVAAAVQAPEPAIEEVTPVELTPEEPEEKSKPLSPEVRLKFLSGLEKKVGLHFGPAAGIFIGELLTDMGIQTKSLTEDQAFDLIDQLSGHMDEGAVAQIEFWAATVLE